MTNRKIKMEDFENDKTDFDDDEGPRGQDSPKPNMSKQMQNQQQLDFYNVVGPRDGLDASFTDKSGIINTMSSVSLLDMTTSNPTNKTRDEIQVNETQLHQLADQTITADGQRDTAEYQQTVIGAKQLAANNFMKQTSTDLNSQQSSAKFGGGKSIDKKASTNSDQEGTNSKSFKQFQSDKSKGSKPQSTLDDILAQNEDQMQKSHKKLNTGDKSGRSGKSGTNSDISAGANPNDLSGMQNLKMNTSLDRSGNISYLQANRSLAEISLVSANNNVFPGGPFIPTLQHPGLFPFPGVSVNQHLNQSLTDLTYSNSVLQNSIIMGQYQAPQMPGAFAAAQPFKKIPKRKRMRSFDQKEIPSTLANGKQPSSETEFLTLLKTQVKYLQTRLKEEILIKQALIKATSHLKKTVQMKDSVIKTLVEKLAVHGVEPLLVQNYQKMLLEKAERFQTLQNQSKAMHEKYLNKLEEVSGSQKGSKHTGSFKNWKASQSQKNITESQSNKSATKQFDQSEKNSARDASNPSNENYVSPDDGLPDKKLSIFDTSKDQDESQVQQPLDQSSTVYGNNTLFYLEHNNSHDKSWLRGFNKQIAGPYKGNQIGNNFDRSVLGGLNGTMLSGNTRAMNRSLLGNSINITNLNMSKNTNMGLGLNPNDRSYAQRYQDPPSQSRILMLDEIMDSQSGVDSSVQRDDELSGIMKDNFNKSISVKYGGNARGDKSAIMLDRSGFGLPNQVVDKSMIQEAGDRSILRGMGLHPEQPRDIDGNRVPIEDSRNQSQILRDISEDQDATALDQTMSNLNDVSNINDATGLQRLSDSQDPARECEEPTQPVRQFYPGRDESLQVIQEESNAENETTQDQGLDQTIRSSNMTISQNQNILGDISGQNQPSEYFDKYFDAQKSNRGQNRSQIAKQQPEKGNTAVSQQRNSAEEDEDCESRFMRLKTSLLEPDNSALGRSIACPHKKPTPEQMKKLLEQRKAKKAEISQLELSDRSLLSIRERSRTAYARKSGPRSSRDLTRQADATGNAVRDSVPEEASHLESQATEYEGRRSTVDANVPLTERRQRSTTIANKDMLFHKTDQHLWKSKVDTLIEEKKQWFKERKELREKLRSLEIKNDQLLIKIKKIRKLMTDEEEALLGFKKMQQNYQEISQIGAGLQTSMIGYLPQVGIYGPNASAMDISAMYGNQDQSRLGISAAIDLGVPGGGGPLTAAGMDNLFTQTTQYMMDPKEMSLNVTRNDKSNDATTPQKGYQTENNQYADPVQGHQNGTEDLRDTLKQNIRQLEKENQLQQELLHQTSLILSNNNQAYDASVNLNLTRDFMGMGAQDISAIANPAAANQYGLMSQFDISQLHDTVRGRQRLDESNFNFEVGEENVEANKSIPGAIPPRRSTLEDIHQKQSNMNKSGITTSQRTAAPNPAVQVILGDQDDVILNETPSASKSRLASDQTTLKKQGPQFNQHLLQGLNQPPLISPLQTPARFASGAQPLQHPLPLDLQQYQQYVQERFQQNDERINSLMQPRGTASFNDLQQLQKSHDSSEQQQLQEGSTDGPGQKGITKMFSFFKNRVRGSVQQEDASQVQQYGADGGQKRDSKSQGDGNSDNGQGMMSPDQVKGFYNPDDIPLRSQTMISHQDTNQLNFNNLVNESFEKQQQEQFYGDQEARPQETPRTGEFGSSNVDHDKTFQSFTEGNSMLPERFVGGQGDNRDSSDGPGFGKKAISPKGLTTSQSNLGGSKDRDPVNESIRSKTSLSKQEEQKGSSEVAQQKRMTFGDTNEFTSALRSQGPNKPPSQGNLFVLDQSVKNSGVQSKNSSMVGFPQADRSKDMSLDFNAIAAPSNVNAMLDPIQIMNISGIQQKSMLDYSNTGRGDTAAKNTNTRDNSFISNIQREKDASYAVYNQQNLSMLQNSQYINASFLAPNLNQSNISVSNTSNLQYSQAKNKTPFFKDLKSKNAGQSKLQMPEFRPDEGQDIGENIPDDNQRQSEEQIQSDRFTLGNNGSEKVEFQASVSGSVPANGDAELAELQQHHHFLQEQQLRQRVLAQQLMHQQALIEQQRQQAQYMQQLEALHQMHAQSSMLGSQHPLSQTAGFISQNSMHLSHSALLQQQLQQQHILRQQQLLAQPNLVSQYRDSLGPQNQVDKNQIRNLFLQMVGRGSQESQNQSPPQPEQSQATDSDTKVNPKGKSYFDNLKNSQKRKSGGQGGP